MFNHSKNANMNTCEREQAMILHRSLSKLLLNHDPETEAMISEALEALKPD